jgi:hypothetical protein
MHGFASNDRDRPVGIAILVPAEHGRPYQMIHTP